MSVKMILQNGPLDGQQQICATLPSVPGSLIYFSLPSYQSFDATGDTVVQYGLQTVYSLVSQGPAPGSGDTWTSSWVFSFEGETPPGVPLTLHVHLTSESHMTVFGQTLPAPQLSFVSMTASSNMIINAADPTPAPPQVVMVGETTMEVDLEFQPSGSVFMEAVTMMVVMPDEGAIVRLEGDTTMEVDPS